MLDTAVHRRATVTATAEDRLLLLQRRAVPALDKVADQPHRLIAAVVRPGRLVVVPVHPDQLLHQGAVICWRVGGAIAKAEKIARALGLAVGARRHHRHTTLLLPAHHQQAGGVLDDVAQRVNGGAFTIGAELQRDIAVATRGVQRVIRKRCHTLQLPRLDLSQAKALIKQRGADRQRNGQPIRVDGRAKNARVDRRITRVALLVAAALGEKGNALAQRAQQLLQPVAVTRQHIKGHQHAYSRARGSDALLLVTVPRVGLPGGCAGGGVGHLGRVRRLACQRTATQARGGDTGPGSAKALQKTSTIQPSKRATLCLRVMLTHVFYS